MKILLASNSPRRRELLKKIYTEFEICSPDIDENFIGTNPEKTVIEIAKRKLSSAKHLDFDIIISADTVVYCDGEYLTKPKDREDAFRILSFLSGKKHYVYTGVAVKKCDATIYFAERSAVQFNQLSPEEIFRYIDGFEVLDKAGSYAIQDGIAVKRYDGSYDNIVGLPTEKLKKYLCG